MKNIILSFFMLSAFFAKAQPSLTAANSNPFLGDVFINYYSDTDTIAVGAAGAAVTWDFSYLTAATIDTTHVVPCSSTPYCDSFTGSTLVEFEVLDSQYSYFEEVGGILQCNGGHVPTSWGGYSFYRIPYKYNYYPATYGSTWRDTMWQLCYDTTMGWYEHDREEAYNVADAYGTLKTPAGVYSNALRVHTTVYNYDTQGTYTQIDTNDSYAWFVPGMHTPAFRIDIRGMNAFGYMPDIEWSTSHSPEAVPVVSGDAGGIKVFPNPATDQLTIISPATYTSFSIINTLGRQVMQLPLTSSQTVLDVKALPPGIYYLSLLSANGVKVQQFVKE
jgi:hypothetical protein